MLWIWVALGAFCNTILPRPTSDLVLHETSHTRFPAQLLKHFRHRVDEDAIIPLRIALRQNNIEKGADLLMNVSHPASPNYGKHLSASEIHAMFAPTEETLKVVEDWLLKSGINGSQIVRYANNAWLAVDVPAKDAESLLSTYYYVYGASNDTTIRLGCDSYYLPALVSQHVDYIKPGVLMSSPLTQTNNIAKRSDDTQLGKLSHAVRRPSVQNNRRRRRPMPHDLQQCDTMMTPACIKALYGIPEPHLADPNNAIGIFAAGDHFLQQDLDLFFDHFSPSIPNGTSPSVVPISGGLEPEDPQNIEPGGEVDLDVDLATSLIYPQEAIVYQVNDREGHWNPPEWFEVFLDYFDDSYCDHIAYDIGGNFSTRYGGYHKARNESELRRDCGPHHLARVISISYGGPEYDWPERYLERQCNEFMKLGLKGHTILAASGDSGVAMRGKETCLLGHGSDGAARKYSPGWPPSCPWLTSVGGTRLYPNQTVKDPESAMQDAGLPMSNPAFEYDGSTGGGFSKYFAAPLYQEGAVSAYFDDRSTPPHYIANSEASNIRTGNGVFNRAGRGIPDVSAIGAFLPIYINGTRFATLFNGTRKVAIEINEWGTSLSAPIFASVIDLLNEERLNVGKSPVGFVNPALYAHPEVLNDIINGSNPACDSPGFQAAKGWDPVTGLGTPNYPAMLDLFMSLP